MEADGIEVKSLDQSPILIEQAKWLWDAWEIMSAKRMWTDAGPQPIPVSEFLAYATYQDITDEVAREDFLYVLSAMDALFLNHVREERRKASEKERQQRKRRHAQRRR